MRRERYAERNAKMKRSLLEIQLAILAALRQNGETSPTVLMQRCNVNQSTLNDLVGNLIALGCVTSSVVGMRVRYKVTDHGKSTLKLFEQFMHEFNLEFSTHYYEIQNKPTQRMTSLRG